MDQDPRGDFFGSTQETPADDDPRGTFFSSDTPAAPESADKLQPKGGRTLKEAGGDLALHWLTGLGANIMAGGRAAYDLATGKTIAQADTRAQQFIKEHTYEPDDSLSKGLIGAWESRANPLNWPGMAISKASDVVGEQTGSPGAAGATTGLLSGGLAALSLKGGMEPLKGEPTTGWGRGPTPSTSAGGKVATAGTSSAIAPDSEPVEGGLPKEATGERAEILRRVGLDKARQSALEGNAKDAATDWQLTRYDEPAGVEAKAQFDSERNALTSHAQKIVQKTGGTIGMDEDALNQRGMTIARPFDSLREWFDDKTRDLYAQADAQAGGNPVTHLQGVEQTLKDPSFRNSLMARGQGHLLQAVENQLEEFRRNNPNGFNVAQSEQVRQWLNSVWSPENRFAIGQLKDALDNDVLMGGGSEIYGPARAIAQARRQVLDNPKGVASLMDADPQTPLNRTTPYVKVPDTLMRLDPDQFANVVKTLKEMPPELQEESQAALSEMKAHLANKVLDAGSSTANQWNAPKVSQVLRANRAKLAILFGDDQEAWQAFNDLDSAGRILRVDQSYPGASAQAANALKRGMMSHVLPKAGALLGAKTGAILGPAGAAAGAVAGEMAGAKGGASLAERGALRKWTARVTELGPSK